MTDVIDFQEAKNRRRGGGDSQARYPLALALGVDPTALAG